MKSTLHSGDARKWAAPFRWVIVFLAVIALPAVAPARIPIEEVQRELQGRYYYLTGKYFLWPANQCGKPAPHFPPNDFYGDLDGESGKALAVDLVRNLASNFYSPPWPQSPVYASFAATTNGFDGLQGRTDLLWGWMPQYTVDNVPSMIGDADMQSPNPINASSDKFVFGLV
jgi:hypothetical protein